MSWEPGHLVAKQNDIIILFFGRRIFQFLQNAKQYKKQYVFGQTKNGRLVHAEPLQNENRVFFPTRV